MAMVSLKALRKDVSFLLHGFWGLPTILGIPWLVDTSLQSQHFCHMAFSLLVFVIVSKFPSSFKGISHWIRALPYPV